MASNIQNTGVSTSTSSTGGTSSDVVRVFDIVMDASHPIFDNIPYNPTLIGMIFYGNKDLDVTSTNPLSLPRALPILGSQKLPLKYELVNIETGPSSNIYPDIGGNNGFNYVYYGVVIPVHGNVVSNELPSQNDLASTTPTSEEAVLASNGTPNQSQPKEIILDDTGNFKPKNNTRLLQPFAGDLIWQGRANQTIRFGTTNKEGANNWSSDNTIGDPLMIWRVGQSKDQQGSTVVEDINGDAVSIYMFSNQRLDNIQLTTTNFDSIQATYVGPIAPTIQLAVAPPPPQPTVSEEPTIQFDTPGPIVETSPPPVTSSFSEAELEDPVFAALAEAEAEGLIDIEGEDYAIAGTELGEEEQQQSSNNTNTDPDPGTDSNAPEEVGEYTAENRVGGYIEFKNISDYRNWLKNGKGKKDYPLKFKNCLPAQDNEGIIDPKSITDMIKQLKADGVNANNSKLSWVKHLVCHITATHFQNQHELMGDFGYGKNWGRHGYNISVDSEGGCNYNVDLLKYHSYGCGGIANVYENACKNNITLQGYGQIKNSNSINISWIGHVKKSLARPDLSNPKNGAPFTGNVKGNTTGPNITAQQAYAYEKLIKYFVEAFPNILVMAHNQITIGSDGRGKGCPGWNHIQYCKNIGIPDNNIFQKTLDGLTKDEWFNYIKPSIKSAELIEKVEKIAQENKGVYFKNFTYYSNKNFTNTADYVYYLVRPKEAGAG